MKNLCEQTVLFGGVSLGNSWEFRPIWVLEISAGPESTRPTVPKIRYVAGVHGNAAVGPELLLEFASVLCRNYGGNPTITKVGVTSQQLYFTFLRRIRKASALSSIGARKFESEV